MHCCHKLMQAIWLFLMDDDDFIHAYEFGIVIECLDGIRWHIFPCFFTYSADYPEKYAIIFSYGLWLILIFRTLLACIKFLAQCPCPCCLIPKSKIGDLGKKVDRQRWERDIRKDSHWLWSTITMVWEWLYEQGVNITSKCMKDNLGPRSLIPTLVSTIYHQHTASLTHYTLVFKSVETLQLQFLWTFCSWPPTWIWTWGMESSFHSPPLHFVCTWWGGD